MAITWQESCLRFFEQKLASAKRRLKWAVGHDRDWMELEDKGDIVSYYEWAVKKAQEEMEEPNE